MMADLPALGDLIATSGLSRVISDEPWTYPNPDDHDPYVTDSMGSPCRVGDYVQRTVWVRKEDARRMVSDDA